MENPTRKLTLSQESLRNLTSDKPQPGNPGTHTCPNGACPSHNPPHCDIQAGDA